MIIKILLVTLAIISSRAFANVEGTEFQHFNPSATGLDFVTVHSSKTLSKGIINLGLFVNYALNGLPEMNIEDHEKYQNRRLLRNELISTDINFGIGIAYWLDLGVNIPLTNYQGVYVNNSRVQFKRNGINDVRLTGKFRLFANKRVGLAFIASANFNQVKDNPFTGSEPGPTYNGQFAFDTRINTFNLGFNAGYRQRNPGTPVEGVPIVPFQDQYIASMAISYLIQAWDVLAITEVFASEPSNKWPKNSKYLGLTREGLVGFKYLWNHNLSFNGGIGSALQSSTSSPDLRFYFGINWSFRPVRKVSRKPSFKVIATRSKVQRYSLRNIEFLYGSSNRVFSGSMKWLDKIMLKTKLSSIRVIKIIGHTDSLGSQAYNKELSRNRAKALAAYIIKNYQVPAQKVRFLGRGELDPIASNENFQGRQRNRRVEVEILFK
ncbi:MAG: OmpA family protein [Oligoflexales bacterium]